MARSRLIPWLFRHAWWRDMRPSCGGKDPADAAHNAVVLEAVAKMAYRTLTLRASAEEVSQALLDRHYLRKHGKNATYGQA